MKKKETIFKEQVSRDLKTLSNTWFYKTSERAIHGIPDIIMCVNGIFVGMELKALSGKVSPLQDHILKKINLANGISIVAAPNNWTTIFNVLHILSKGGRIDRANLGTH